MYSRGLKAEWERRGLALAPRPGLGGESKWATARKKGTSRGERALTRVLVLSNIKAPCSFQAQVKIS